MEYQIIMYVGSYHYAKQPIIGKVYDTESEAMKALNKLAKLAKENLLDVTYLIEKH